MEKLPASWKRGFAAAKSAREHSNGERPGEKMGAALFSGSILVSVGFNVYDKTHPSTINSEFYIRGIHAEHSAIIKRRHYDDFGQVLYVYRETIHAPACSKPCVSCMAIIKLAGIKKVRYINSNGIPEEMKV